jgi:uncharacterized membrane protein YidH (DUF202 family)
MPPRLLPLFIIGPLLALSWVVLALFEPDGPGRAWEYIGLGYLFGTLFGQTTLAAAWAAFGPLPWFWRLAGAPLWLLTLWASLVSNISLHGGPSDAWIIVLLGGCLVGQWLLVLVPLVGIALGHRVQLQHQHDVAAREAAARPRLQFGIRQLMILTAIVAVALGALRWLVLSLAVRLGERGMGEAPVFIFLAVAAVVMTLPLVMALLLPRWWIPAAAAVLVFAGLATFWETTLLALLPRTPGPDMGHFIFINAFTAAWIVVIVGVLRLFGYHLAPIVPRKEV